MQIQYVANGMKRTVRDSVGKVLIARRIAREVEKPGQVDAAPDVAPGHYARTDMQPVDQSEDISPITGKPKRRYSRRDLQAEK